MRRRAALLLALLLASPGAGSAAPGDGTDPALQAEMERLLALRTQDVPVFLAGVRSLEARPPPVTRAQREELQLLRAYRLSLEGRPGEAAAVAQALSDRAEAPALRLAAGSLAVNMLSNIRQFEEALRRLHRLLLEYDAAPAELRDALRSLWVTAAILYQEMGKAELTRHYAERVLEGQPSPRQACLAGYLKARADELAEVAREPDIGVLRGTCDAAGENGVWQGFIDGLEARHLRRLGRLDEAQRHLEARLAVADAVGYPLLAAELHALDAELLLALGDLTRAEAQARAALSRAANAPTSLSAAMAEKVLFEVARQRGDDRAALSHLQAYVTAERALADEARIKDRAVQLVQHEMLQREQAFRLAEARHQAAILKARLARAEARNTLLALLSVLGLLAGAAAWAWSLRRDERRYRALSESDRLTGFANRAHFTRLVGEALLGAAKRGEGIALVGFDLDHFKRINDEHGHLNGDAVLRAVSEAIRALPAAARRRTVGRLGGEEFAVLLEGCSREAALEHAEACRRAIAGLAIPLDGGGEVRISASFGVATLVAGEAGLEGLLAAADRALYRAKHEGRNRVVALGPGELRDAA